MRMAKAGTIHFHYLMEQHGGFVRMARDLDEHVVMLSARSPRLPIPRCFGAFVGDFLRPLGIDRPVSPLLAEIIERTFAALTTAGAPKASTSDLSPSNLEAPYVVSGLAGPWISLPSAVTEGFAHQAPYEDDPDAPGPERFKA
jgi:hypothetical protein